VSLIQRDLVDRVLFDARGHEAGDNNIR
jgi:hypothetical protein